MNEPEQEAGEAAEDIVAAASHRGLGDRPLLRRISALLWSGFLGACCLLAVVVLMPEEWLQPPFGLDRIAAVFFGGWVLSLIPAGAAWLLAPPRADKVRADEDDEDDADAR